MWTMEFSDDPYALTALLDWQIELGATEAIGDTPVDRFAAQEAAQAAAQAQTSPGPGAPVSTEAHAQGRAEVKAAPVQGPDPVMEAKAAAAAAGSLEELRAAMAAYPHCELRLGAKTLVFADGNPEARIMIVGEAPGRDEDIQGKPFVGRAGQLLDRMLAAIDMARDAPDPEAAVYITNILPWRPPQNRDPSPEEMAMMMPFVERHIALADPEVLILMGNISCQALLGRRGITRLRGNWHQVLDRPTLPMFHPAYLLRNPAAKREAWADLLALQAKLKDLS